MNSHSNSTIDAHVTVQQQNEQGPLAVSPPAPPPKETKPVFSPRASVAAMMITNGSPQKPTFPDLDLLLPPPPSPPASFPPPPLPPAQPHPPSSPLSMPDFAAFGSLDDEHDEEDGIKLVTGSTTTGYGATTTGATTTATTHNATMSRLGRSITITTSSNNNHNEDEEDNSSFHLGTTTEGSGNGSPTAAAVAPRPPRSVASPRAPRAERSSMQRSLWSPSTTAGSSFGSSQLDSMRDSVRSELGQRSQLLTSSRTGPPQQQRGRAAAKPGGVRTTRSRSHRRVAVSDGFADAPPSPPSPHAVVLPTEEGSKHNQRLNIRVLHQHTHHLHHQLQPIAHGGPPLPPADFGQIRPMTGQHRRFSRSVSSSSTTAAAPCEGGVLSPAPHSSQPQQLQPPRCVAQRSHSVVVHPSEPRPATDVPPFGGDARAAMARSATVVPPAASFPPSSSATRSSPSKGALSPQSARALALSQSSLASGGTHFMSLSGSSSPPAPVAVSSPHLFTSTFAPAFPPPPNLSRSSSSSRVPPRGDLSVSSAVARDREENDEDDEAEEAAPCAAAPGRRRRDSASEDYTRAPYDNDCDAFCDEKAEAPSASSRCFIGDFVCAVPMTTVPPSANNKNKNPSPSSSSLLSSRPAVASLQPVHTTPAPPPSTNTTVTNTTNGMLSPPTTTTSRSSFSLILHSDWRTVFVAASGSCHTIPQVSFPAVSAQGTQPAARSVRAGSGVAPPAAAAGAGAMQSSTVVMAPGAAFMGAPKDIMSGAGSSLTSNSILATMMLSSSGSHVAIVPNNNIPMHQHQPHTVTVPGTAPPRHAVSPPSAPSSSSACVATFPPHMAPLPTPSSSGTPPRRRYPMYQEAFEDLL